MPPTLADNPELEPFRPQIEARIHRFRSLRKALEARAGSLTDFANAHLFFGFHYDPQQQGWWYREWAPAAQNLYLMGDFNGWERFQLPLTRNADNPQVWERFLPDAAWQGRLAHGSRVKVVVVGANGYRERLPAYIRRAVQDPETQDFTGQIWAPEPFRWQNAFDPASLEELFIYESHVGMAQEEARIGGYREFAERILPLIAAAGYNALQLMAVAEHPYYGSFGYHVSNFFAPSSRFGTPEDLKYLIDQAHGRGMAVIMDVVHSHGVKNEFEGLANFDGSGGQYFHAGPRGEHPAWDSRLFDYEKPEVQQFLLSNLKYWLEEFRFDGFRFDGVTSMLYHDNGLEMAFEGNHSYFTDNTDESAIRYLQLANTLVKELKPGAITVAEDVSGMPGIGRPAEEGGMGFDYRLGMGLPDFWVNTLEQPDEDWSVGQIWNTLHFRRHDEQTVAYVESHDQALVGDKTLAFRLMEQEMYHGMAKGSQNLKVDRGLALHKMIRLVTMALGGEAWLNFMGNEFGHPEWIDFPREGNNWSYDYARRQWDLGRADYLQYHYLGDWDRAIVQLMKDFRLFWEDFAEQLVCHEADQVLAFERGGLLFHFNWNPTESFFGYGIPVREKGVYQLRLDSDAAHFGGHARLDPAQEFHALEGALQLYSVNRSVQVLEKVR